MGSSFILSAEDFENFKPSHVGRNIVFLESVGSTNDHAKELAAQGALSGTVVIAGEQVAGKGRLGRSWDGAGSGKDIYMTILLRPDISGENAARLTLLAGICTARAVNEISEKKAGIKWPNDVVINGKKICGILTESAFKGKSLDYAAVGIGINVNREDFPPELADKATSLYLENGRQYKRADIIKRVISLFDEYYGGFVKAGISSFIDEYRRLCVNIGKTVTIHENGTSYVAGAIGIGDNGALEVVTEGGEKRIIESGEVSVRGIYGYI